MSPDIKLSAKKPEPPAEDTVTSFAGLVNKLGGGPAGLDMALEVMDGFED
jgi:hypothetical protein